LGIAAEESFNNALDAADRFNAGFASNQAATYFDDIRKNSDGAAQAVADAMGKTEGMADVIDSSAKDIAKLLDGLNDKVKTFGLSAEEVNLSKLIDLGATQGQLEDAASAIDRLQSLQKTAEAMKAVNKQILRSPLSTGESERGNITIQASISGRGEFDPLLRQGEKQQTTLERILNAIERNQQANIAVVGI